MQRGHVNTDGYKARHGSMLAIWRQQHARRRRYGISAAGAMLLAWNDIAGLRQRFWSSFQSHSCNKRLGYPDNILSRGTVSNIYHPIT